MKLCYLFCILILALSASACTIAPQNGNVETQLKLPLTYQHWQMEHYIIQGGGKVCKLSSGYNGLTVYIKHENGKDTVFVKSNRMMKPGATLTVNVNGKTFEAYETFFSNDSAPALIESLEKGDKAYLEWQEIGGASGSEPIHVQNIVLLDDFAPQWKQCEAAVK